MDANKASKLREIGYKVSNCCGMCKFAEFKNLSSFWGECSINEYEHQKHLDSKRHLSVSAFGGCQKFEISDEWDIRLHGFKEFLIRPA